MTATRIKDIPVVPLLKSERTKREALPLHFSISAFQNFSFYSTTSYAIVIDETKANILSDTATPKSDK